MTATADPKPLTILELRASNVKRLRAVAIKPDGNLVVLSGKNGAGKTSVLDSITYALAGERAVCKQPVRRGQDKGTIEVDLGEYRVRRTFTKEGGGSLVVLSPEGARYPSPQALLDKIAGTLTFDPLAFAGMKEEEQAETLRALVNLDFKELDAEHARVFAERTTVNRDGKALVARFDAAPHHDGVPEAEQRSAEILSEREAAESVNERNDGVRQAAKDAQRDADTAEAAIETAGQHVDDARSVVAATERKIAQLQAELVEQRAEVVRREGAVETKRGTAQRLREAATAKASEAAELVDVDLAPFATRLVEVEAVNKKVRENLARAALERQVEAKRAERESLTSRLEAIERQKAEAIAAAKMPVEGLGFDASGVVTFNGIPLDQASHAERLRVSVAIGLAMNPRLKVLLIRDASLLDEDGMRLVAQMAQDAGAQFWLERVGQDEATTVLIEDGHVAGVEQPAETEGAVRS